MRDAFYRIAAGSEAKALSGDPQPRARDLGIPFDGETGAFNSITDVPGVLVGHATLISGEGPKAIRTGVTAILPTGSERILPVFAAWFSLNGAGEMTGTSWIEESGYLFGPVMLTNTLSVGVVRDAAAEWLIKKGCPPLFSALPVVAETWDGMLSDAEGFHVDKSHAFRAIDSAAGGPVLEGNVGGGTGMKCYGFKGGIGTSSRRVKISQEENYALGVLVQANHGSKEQLRMAGLPVGRLLLSKAAGRDKDEESKRSSSIIIIIATDAPLLPHQLKRLAKRASLGLARSGSFSANFSGDIFLAFSTASKGYPGLDRVEAPPEPLTMISNNSMDPFFAAAVQATDEAIINALVAARTMVGKNGTVVEALPRDEVREIMSKYREFLGSMTEESSQK